MLLAKSSDEKIKEVTALFIKSVRQVPISRLSNRQICILFIAYQQPVTIATLHELTDVDKPALSRCVDVLEGMGLVSRREVEMDRRVVEVTPTIEGRRAVRVFCGL